MNVLAIAGADAATAFVEIGCVALVLAALSRLAGRLTISAIPLYLLAGLSVGDGGIARLQVSSEFIELVAEIGVLLLLLTLGLEYSAEELRHGLRTGVPTGTVDALANFVPGFAVGLAVGWELEAAVLLGGVTWVSSSGIVSKVLTELDRLGNRETPAILNLLVIEDLAMAVFLPVAAALALGSDAFSTARTVGIALVAVGVILLIALRLGDRLSSVLEPGGDESLLLAVFGLTLLVGGIAQHFQVSAAIGAFLVGLALSGPVQERAAALIEPLRDLFAAVFFLFFGFQIHPADLAGGLAVASVLLVLGGAGKLASGWFAAARAGVARPGRIRAGVTLMARGEFSVVIASLGAGLASGHQLAAVTAAFVLLTAVVGPIAARRAGAVPLATRSP
ncbi:MAG TPA: cation:proton antiporter [Acidimicrobiales bacterium]|nr:cation:proton antiporter [Acidimicrobiales bacterium]